MALPVDTSKVRFVAAEAPYPMLDRTTRMPRTNFDGQPLWFVPVVAMTEGQKAEVMSLKVPGEPKGIRAFMAVKVTGFVVGEYTAKDGKHYSSYEADSVEPDLPGK